MGTGVASVDEQHRALVETINGLEKALEQDLDAARIKERLDFLASYVVEHFGHEEKVMAERRCPAAAKNLAEHKKLLETYVAWSADYDREGHSPEKVRALHRFLTRWLVSHICGVDGCLKQCRKDRPAAAG